jgi:hypothetical protein
MPALLCMTILPGARRSTPGSLLVITCCRCSAHALAAFDRPAFVFFQKGCRPPVPACGRRRAKTAVTIANTARTAVAAAVSWVAKMSDMAEGYVAPGQAGWLFGLDARMLLTGCSAGCCSWILP